MDVFATLVVRTDNSAYRITIVTPHRREVVVQGGAFFPERTRACLNGSSGGWQLFETRVDRYWAALEFHAGDEWIITSHVRTIGFEPSPTGRPC